MEKEELFQYVGFQCCERSLQRGVKAEAKNQEECTSCDSWCRCIKDDAWAFEAAISTRYWYRCLQWESNGLSLFYGCFQWDVEKKVDDPYGKLARLIKYTTVDAKEITKNSIQLPAEIEFETAKQLLTERYGDLYRIRAVYGKEIEYWSQIKSGDADAYQKFQNFLVKLENIGHLQSWNVLDTQALCACYCRSYQALLETNGLKMSWLYVEGTKGNQVW